MSPLADIRDPSIDLNNGKGINTRLFTSVLTTILRMRTLSWSAEFSTILLIPVVLINTEVGLREQVLEYGFSSKHSAFYKSYSIL